MLISRLQFKSEDHAMGRVMGTVTRAKSRGFELRMIYLFSAINLKFPSLRFNLI
jgi:hypothetical protein